MAMKLLWLVLLCYHSAWAGLLFQKMSKTVQVEAIHNQVTFSFPFVNNGKTTVRLTHYEAPCDNCLEVKTAGNKKIYRTGEKGLLQCVFQIKNYQGKVTKKVAIWTANNKTKMPSYILSCHIDILPAYTLSQKVVRWQLNAPNVTKEVTLNIMPKYYIKLQSVKSLLPVFEVSYRQVKPQQYIIAIKPKSTDKPIASSIRIYNLSDHRRLCKIILFATVQKTIATTKKPNGFKMLKILERLRILKILRMLKILKSTEKVEKGIKNKS